MPTSSNPAAELRRVTRRIAELQKQQRELVSQIGLSSNEETIVVNALTLANDVVIFLEHIEGTPNEDQRRRGVQFLRRMDRASKQLEKLPDTDGKAAAASAIAEAVQHLFNVLFRS